MSAIVPDPAVASYGIAMVAGGPPSITIGWLFVGGMVTFLGEVAVSAAIDFGAATTTPVEAGEVDAG